MVDIWIKCDKNIHCSLVYVKKFSLDCYSPSFHFEDSFTLQVLRLLKELLCEFYLLLVLILEFFLSFLRKKVNFTIFIKSFIQT